MALAHLCARAAGHDDKGHALRAICIDVHAFVTALVVWTEGTVPRAVCCVWPLSLTTCAQYVCRRRNTFMLDSFELNLTASPRTASRTGPKSERRTEVHLMWCGSRSLPRRQTKEPLTLPANALNRPF